MTSMCAYCIEAGHGGMARRRFDLGLRSVRPVLQGPFVERRLIPPQSSAEHRQRNDRCHQPALRAAQPIGRSAGANGDCANIAASGVFAMPKKRLDDANA
jgi:hypothetical protein